MLRIWGPARGQMVPMRDSLGCVQLKLGTCILNEGGGIIGREWGLEGGRGHRRRAEGFTRELSWGANTHYLINLPAHSALEFHLKDGDTDS